MVEHIAGRMRCGFLIVCGLLSIPVAVVAGGLGVDSLQSALQVSRWGTVSIKNNNEVLVDRDAFTVYNASGDKIFCLEEKTYVPETTLWVPSEKDPVFVEPVIDEKEGPDGTRIVTVQAVQNGVASVTKEIRLRGGTVEVALKWEVFGDGRAEYELFIPCTELKINDRKAQHSPDGKESFPKGASEISFSGDAAGLMVTVKDSGAAHWKSLREYREGRNLFYRLSLALTGAHGKKNTAEVIVGIKGLTCK